MDKKGKLESLITIKYSPVEGGVELFVKSERIHKWMKEQSTAASLDTQTVSSSSSPVYLRGKKFYKLPQTQSGAVTIATPADFVGAGNQSYSTCLLASTELGTGLTVKFSGMVAKSALDAAAKHLKEQAMQLYKGFMAPYTVRMEVSVNEEV